MSICCRDGVDVLLTAGWKSVSLVDIVDHPSFTVWLCGCNLKCPFCHNWRLAERDSSLCKYITVNTIIEEALASRLLVDYVHVTGGEPLLQYKSVVVLFRGVHEAGLKTSLNSNLTIPSFLDNLLTQGVVDHIATDAKIPPEELYGLPVQAAKTLWNKFLESLELIKQYEIPLELRIPVYGSLDKYTLLEYLSRVVRHIDQGNTIVVLNPLLTEPLVSPRNPEWLQKRANPPRGQLEVFAELIKELGFKRVVVKSIPGFGSE